MYKSKAKFYNIIIMISSIDAGLCLKWDQFSGFTFSQIVEDI